MSVRENLTLGRPGATDADVDEALRVAQAEFVHDLPWGLATRIGEQGLSLSGGQRQRLALARAVLGRPSVLVLDDPLSALDVHTEALVERALRDVLAGTTALVVAHRPSTVLLADRVALLSGGRITAVGRHSDLLAEVPEYRDLLAQESELAEVLVSAVPRADAVAPATGPASDAAENWRGVADRGRRRALGRRGRLPARPLPPAARRAAGRRTTVRCGRCSPPSRCRTSPGWPGRS